VMEPESRPPDDPDEVKSKPSMASGLVLSRVISAPEPRRSATDVPYSPSFDTTARKRDLPMEGPYRPVSGHSSPPARPFWSSGSTSPRGDLGEPPDKRPRLEYIPEKVESDVDSSKSRMFPHHVCDGGVPPVFLISFGRRVAEEILLLTSALSPVQSICSCRPASVAGATFRGQHPGFVLARIVRQLFGYRVAGGGARSGLYGSPV
jgi:hypothetical protein